MAGTECDWHGVTCDGNQEHVTEITLNNNNLIGIIPSSISDLPYLIYLALSYNQVSGNLPAELGNLINLEQIYLGNNNLSGGIPSELGDLSNLTGLDLSENALTGTIPAELGSLASMEELQLWENQLDGTIPPELGNLSNLISIDISFNRLTGGIPPELGSLSNVEYVYLESNNLSGPVPAALMVMASLQDDGGLILAHNALYTDDDTLRNFLDTKAPDWQDYQTVYPADLSATLTSSTSVELSWTPIVYTDGPGGYEVYHGTVSGGPYTLVETTADKNVSGTTIEGLTEGEPHYFQVRTVTNAYDDNQNDVYSEYSPEVSSVRVENIDPLSGPVLGGTTVTINGAGFGSAQGAGTVTFGDLEATSYNGWSDTEIVCITPAHGGDVVDVTVNTDDGQSGTRVEGYTFVAGIPDTGQTKCYNNSVEIACPEPWEAFYGQDAHYSINPQSYTKLDDTGQDLPASATSWAMVRDNITGLIWEVKTDDGLIHDKDNSYTWADAQVFIDELNSDPTGFTDWRLPTPRELESLVQEDGAVPRIDPAYFPNTGSGAYWTSVNLVSTPQGLAWVLNFASGVLDPETKTSSCFVRAVRGGQTQGRFVDNGDGTVTDTVSGLMWQQATNSGLNWQQALAYCETMGLADRSDWRLPTRHELQSLVDYSANSPAFDTTVFPDTGAERYLTSTTVSNSVDNAWYVYFKFGIVTTISKTTVELFCFRAVRGGSGPMASGGCEPSAGLIHGGTTVTITGSNFGEERGTGAVTFDGIEAVSYTSWSDTEIVCVNPAHDAGVVDVVVTYEWGESATITAGFTYVEPRPVPDTGQTACYDDSQEIPCPASGASYYGQDAQYNLNPHSYTKLDSSGNDLPDTAVSWAMVRDNLTGLIWEVKTSDAGLHYHFATYTKQDAQDVFIAQVNAEQFGGYDDWRLPTVRELAMLVNGGANLPAIDTDYFPRTQSDLYWSASTDGEANSWVVQFDCGNVSSLSNDNSAFVRAVRGPRSTSVVVDNGDGTITDTATGLMWQKDYANYQTWSGALDYCETLNLAGYDDWRVPNRNELHSLVEYTVADAGGDAAQAYTDDVWSSTTSDGYPDNAWGAYSFQDAYITPIIKTGTRRVRAVRSGLAQVSVDGCAPDSGLTSGGDSVTVTGSNFGQAQGSGTVTFGGSEAASYTSWSDTEIICVTPAHDAGTVDVVVDTDGGGQSTLVSGFTFNTPAIYTITATAGAGGSISPSGAVNVTGGTDQAFTITPDSGCHVADVLVDSVSVGAVTEYTFTNVTDDHTIAATFAINTYTIAASAGSGGSISPTGQVTVSHGDTPTFTVTASAGYQVEQVLVDGIPVSLSGGQYTFAPVTMAHTIEASFETLPPDAGFIAAPLTGLAPLPVQFTDQSSGVITAWSWDFGDTGASDEASPAHMYASPGLYTVTLTVTGPGGSDQRTRTNYIEVISPVPSADFSGNPTNGDQPLLVDFSDLSTGDITSWQWDFGDGWTNSAQSPSHTYDYAGVYTVTLTVAGPQGSDAKVRTDYITVNEVLPTVEWTTSTQTVTEATGQVTLTVELSDARTSEVRVPYTVGGTSSNPEDHDLAAGEIIIPAGQQTGSTTFSVIDDPWDEADETVVVTLTTPSGAALGAVKTQTVTIQDNDVNHVNWTTQAQTVAEDIGQVTLTAILEKTSGLDVSVPFTVGGTASRPADHNLAPGSLTIPAGSLMGAVSFNVVADSTPEPDETVVVTMGQPANATLGTVTVQTVTIVNEGDLPVVSWAAAGQQVNESVGQVTVNVELSQTSSSDVLVPFTVSGSATGGTDHDLASGQITVPAGSTAGTRTFNVTNDVWDEPDETIVLTINSPTGATVGAGSVHIVTILDDDQNLVNWATGTVAKSESAGQVTLTVTVNPVSQLTVSVPFTVSGTAQAGGLDHNLASDRIVVEPGNSIGTKTFSIIDDLLDEPDETVVVTLGAPENATLGTLTEVTLTIQDNDDPPSLSWTTPARTVSETVGPVTATAVLSRASGREITAGYTVGGTASAGDDHDLIPGSLTIPAGQTSAWVTFNLVDDTLAESDETVDLTLDAPVNATLGTDSLQTITIADDDTTPTVYWTSESQEVSENAGAVTVTAFLTSPAGQDVTVPFAVSGTAAGAGVDHNLADGQIIIPEGQLIGTRTFLITDDALDEPDENVIVTMGQPLGAPAGTTTVQTITILDNDPAPTVNWSQAGQTLPEDTGQVTVEALLSAASGWEVVVPFVLSGSAGGGDHDLDAFQVVIPAGQVSGALGFNIVDDAGDEPDETMILTMTQPAHAALGATHVQTLTIVDNDDPPTISLTTASQTVAESAGSATFTASVDQPSGFDITWPYAVTGTASRPADHTLAAGTLTIFAGQTQGSRTFSIVNDTLNENNETVIVTMGQPVNAQAGATTEQTITIEDNDPLPTVDLTSPSQRVVESVGQAAVTATLGAVSGREVRVPFTVAGTASPGGVDHDLADGEIVIPAGQAAGTASFTVNDDQLEEGDETVVVTMGIPVNASAGTVGVCTVTIEDNDAVYTVDLTTAAQTVSEGAGQATVTATLNLIQGQEVRVPFTVTGTAVGGGVDHDLADGEIVIPAGQKTGLQTFQITDDNLDEDNETVVLTMGSPSGAGPGPVTVHTVTIDDNDPLPTANWSSSFQSVSEAVGQVTVQVLLNTAAGREVRVPYTTIGGTATGNGTDHDLTADSLVIPAGQVSASLNFNVMDDELDEANETVALTMGSLVNAQPGSTITQTVTIIDDDDSPSLSDIGDQTINEDASTGAMGFTVSDGDTDNAGLVVSAVSSNLVLAPVSRITFGGAGSGRTITVAPAANQHGQATITVFVSDGFNQASDSFVLTVNPVNDPPQAVDDVAETDADSPVTVDVLANDTDVDQDDLSVTSHTHPANGDLVYHGDGTFTYTPTTIQQGQDSFTYTIGDGHGGQDEALVNIYVNLEINHRPTAEPQEVTTGQDTEVAVTLTGSDVDDDPLTFEIVDGPGHGQLTGTPPEVTYTPEAEYFGGDGFTFRAHDGQEYSEPAEVSVTVRRANRAPVAGGGGAAPGVGGGAQVDIPPVTANWNKAECGHWLETGEGLTIYGSGLNRGNSLLAKAARDFSDSETYLKWKVFGNNIFMSVDLGLAGTVSAQGSTGWSHNGSTLLSENTWYYTRLKIQPDRSFETVTALDNYDDQGGVVFDSDSGTVDEADWPRVVNGLLRAGFFENYGGTAAYLVLGQATTNAPGIITVGQTVYDFEEGAAPDQFGLTGDWVVDDTGGGIGLSLHSGPTSSGSATLAATNLAGVSFKYRTEATGYSVGFYIDDELQGGYLDGTISDCWSEILWPLPPGGHTLKWEFVGGPASLWLDDITPLVSTTLRVSTYADTTVDILLPASDPDGDPLTYQVITPPEHGELTTLSANLRRYTPETAWTGTDFFTYQVNDGALDSNEVTVIIEVLPPSDAPVAVDDEVFTDEDVSVTTPSVLDNDSDPNGDPLEVTAYTQPAHGWVNHDGLGVFTYHPDANYNGSDSFEYTVDDGHGETDQGTVLITINMVNDQPVASGRSLITDNQNPLEIELNASDVDGDPLLFEIVDQPAHGSIESLTADGKSQLYTPIPGYAGSDSFTFKAYDEHDDQRGYSNVATVNLTVKPIITALAGPHGSISPAGDVLVNPGSSRYFSIVADTGCYIVDVLVDGVSKGAVTGYTFYNVQANHTIEVTFDLQMYDLIAVTSGGGSITPYGYVNVAHGADQTFTITPDSGWSVQNVYVDQAFVGAVSHYTFQDVDQEHTIIALFTQEPKDESIITCQVSKTDMVVGEPLVVSGQITPQPTWAGALVDVTLISPGGQETHRSVVANSQGEFNYETACGDLAEQGLWSVRTSWHGDDGLNGDTSDQPLPTVAVATAKSRLTLDATSQAIKFGDAISLSGKLSPQPDCSGALADQPVRLVVTGPDGQGGTATDEITVLTNDQWGHFILADYDGLNTLGEWTVQAFFDGNEAHEPAGSDVLKVRVVETAGYAIIVQGKVNSQEGLASHNKTTNFVYHQLLGRGLLEDDIKYFNYDLDQPGVDGLPLKSAINAAVTGWAMAKMNQKPANLYIIMIDHGLENVFYIHPDLITAEELGGWLNTLQAGLVGQAAEQEIITLLGFCRSGSFLAELAGPHRVNIASAAAGEASYKGPGDVDANGEILRDGEYFITEFFKAASLGKSVKGCFEEASRLTRIFTQSTDLDSNTNGPYFDSARQHPLLDDNNDGLGSHQLGDPDGDGGLSQGLFVGVSSITGNDPGDVAVIKTAPPVFLGEDEDTVPLLWARVDDSSRLRSIWVEIKPPDYAPASPDGSEQLTLELTKTLWEGYDPAQDHYFWTELGGFDTPGTYQVFYFAKDDLTGNVSPLMETRVYRAVPGNLPPEPFDLISPEDGQEVLTSVVLDWEDTIDPDGDLITYSLLISPGDDSFSDPIRKDSLTVSTCLVTPEDGMTDLTDYYWKVLAVDQYGAVTETPVRMFRTNNTNPLIAWLTGRVYDQATNLAISGARVTLGGASEFITDLNGNFLLMITPGSYDITVIANGFYSMTAANVILEDGGITTRDFALVSGCQVPAATADLTYPETDPDGDFEVTWSPTADTEDYVLERATDDSFDEAQEVYRGTDCEYQESGLAPGVYYYRLKGENSCGAGQWTSGPAVIVGCLLPAAPSTLTVPSVNRTGSFVVTWSEVVSADTYNLERAENELFTDSVTAYSGSDLSHTETGLANGIYYYRVRAVNACGASDWLTAGPVEVKSSGRKPVAIYLLLIDDEE